MQEAEASSAKNLLFQNRIENEIVVGDKVPIASNELKEDEKNKMETKLDVSIPQATSTTKASHPVPLKNYLTGEIRYDTLHASEEADQVRLLN